MNYTEILATLGKVDIYLIDQILKNRYALDHTILDAGCAEGRNLKWFYANNYNIYGIDTDKERLANAKLKYPKNAANFQLGNLGSLPFKDMQFHHVICNAVLHFAKNEKHFTQMFSELIRVLKPNGSLFVRMASNIGLDGNVPYLKEGKTNIEGKYFLSRERIKKLLHEYNLEFMEPIKTTNVQDLRAMTTLVLRKM